MKKFLVNLLCGFVPSQKKRHEIRRKLLTKPQPYYLGRHSYVGMNFVRMHKDTIVGAFCSIGSNVALGPSQHPTDWLSTAPFQYIDWKKITKDQKLLKYEQIPVSCGNDVWIGNNVTVKDGVNISDGAVIGSNSVVTHDVPPYAIVAGCPAKIIRYRFSNDIIQQLLQLKWWDLSDEQIAKLPFDDVEKCIKELKKIRKNK